MLSPSTKIVMTGFLGVILLIGVYVLMAMYANSIVQDRAISRLLVGIKLSSLSDSEKQKITDEVSSARAKASHGIRVDFSRSDAKLQKMGLTSAQCTAKLIDFDRNASVCLSDSSHKPLEVLFSSCPPADTLAQEIKADCGIDLGWR